MDLQDGTPLYWRRRIHETAPNPSDSLMEPCLDDPAEHPSTHLSHLQAIGMLPTCPLCRVATSNQKRRAVSDWILALVLCDLTAARHGIC
jgi:hypothetical protein